MNTVEVWRPIAGWAGLYEVSSMGRVRSAPREKRMHHGGLRTYGGRVLQGGLYGRYWVVNLRDAETGRHETCKTHRLVLQTFVGAPPDGLEGRHLDDDKSNNSLSNLAWGTALENGADKVANGKSLKGEANHQAKLSDAKVRQIRTSTASTVQLATAYSVSAVLIRKVRRRLAWTHID